MLAFYALKLSKVESFQDWKKTQVWKQFWDQKKWSKQILVKKLLVKKNGVEKEILGLEKFWF